MNPTLIGVDLAKHSFAVCEVNDTDRVLQRHEFKRQAFAAYLVQLPAGTQVAMEACGGAHYWARKCLEFGLVPRVMAAQFVRPFRKGKTAKNDRNDAEAIATAARQGNMRFVPVKVVDEQARLSWHRIRDGHKQAKLAIGNRIRGLLAEFGVIVAQGDAAMARQLADLDALTVPDDLKTLLHLEAREWARQDDCLTTCTQHIQAHARQDYRCQRIRDILGVGAVTADAFVATIGNGQDFKNGRQMAAWFGLVPKQATTGGRVKLGAITRDGNAYLRTLLVQGARSSHKCALATDADKATPEQRWIQTLDQRTLYGKVLVAIANKHARQIWAILAHDVDYDPCAGMCHAIQPEATAA